MDCTCRLPGIDSTEMGRSGFQFQLLGEANSDRKILKPAALTRGKGGGHHGGYHGGYHGHQHGVSKPSLSSIIPLALTAILAGLLAFGNKIL